MELKMLIPRGRIQKGVTDILTRCGLTLTGGERSYRPRCSRTDIQVKLLKPQNIPELVALGRHHCGFTGRDWIEEQEADVVELLDLNMDPARIVFAVPEDSESSSISLVASEYTGLAKRFLRDRYPEAKVIRSWGTTEALPPDDADAIIDVVSSGDTLRMNRLTAEHTLLQTSTRFIANRQVYTDCAPLREKIDTIKMLITSCMNASSRRLLEMNIPQNALGAVTALLPCMKAPTIARLQGESGFSVRAAVPVSSVPALIPRLVAMGATDILESRMERILTGGCQ